MKNLLLFTALLIFGVSNAQFIVWETTFDTPEERAGWTFYDGNNNNNTWTIGKHVVRKAATPNMYEEVSPDNVLRYSRYIPNVVGGPANLKADYNNDIEDWVISPEIDLTAASGDIILAAMIGRVSTYNTTSTANNTDKSVFVYVSTPLKPVPDVTDFKALRTDITAAYANGNISVIPKILKITNADYIAAGNTLFAQATADLSQYAGQKIYIGFWQNNTVVNNPAAISSNPFKDTNSSATFQIDEIQVFASALLGLEDVNAPKIVTQLVQNPVVSTLQLQLNPVFEPTTTFVKVYNMAGQEVLATAYKDQIEVSVLASGTYIVHITNGTVVEKLKFIKK
ncbi:T9SS type A sorting domain-containing protein [Flavobacterium hydrophilum]|uniref:Secretion protein n=1 Tax=Flavobacterium hydrophilum TaxID=2211445 RepID=A0A2V4C7B3_9FLAO|nr:T9SS type A sorting domain-containing protein [Flavobacterium hydrophilum]PXY46877.1 secretion protein [Flavobacterium hydrophilum]